MTKLGWLALAAAALGVTAPAYAKSKVPPKVVLHNFVRYDLSAGVSATLSPERRLLSITLIDASSATRKGDTVEFDTLTLSPVAPATGPANGAATQASIVADTNHYQVSCGWQTLRNVPRVTGAVSPRAGLFNQPGFLQDSILQPNSSFHVVIDRMCESILLQAEKGAESVDAAIAVWKDRLAPLPPNTITTQARLQPEHQSAANSATPHRFVAIQTDAKTGNQMFLDRASVVRNGQSATARSLVLLGPKAQLLSNDWAPVSALRDAQYDCAAKTMRITAQIAWDRFATPQNQSQTSGALRSAANSPVVAKDIDAVCTDALPVSGDGFASVEDTWSAVREHWPAPPHLKWVACLWEHLPAEQKAGALQDGSERGHHRITVAKLAPQQLQACAAPAEFANTAPWMIQTYGAQRTMLEALAAKKISEQALLAAWHGLSLSTRLRLMRISRTYTADDLLFRNTTDARVADTLSVDPSDGATRDLIARFIDAQASVEHG